MKLASATPDDFLVAVDLAEEKLMPFIRRHLPALFALTVLVAMAVQCGAWKWGG